MSPSPRAGKACRRFIVTGRVQGVFFRDSARQVAKRLGLAGYAKNRPDGSVEVLACGPVAGLDQLAEWLEEGPEMAQVTRVSVDTVDVEAPGDFRIA